jgi:hypothetical protein
LLTCSKCFASRSSTRIFSSVTPKTTNHCTANDPTRHFVSIIAQVQKLRQAPSLSRQTSLVSLVTARTFIDTNHLNVKGREQAEKD